MPEVMEKKKIRDIIKEHMKGPLEASLATVTDGKPWVRYVMVRNVDDTLDLYCSTSIKSRKVEQIKKDPNVHLLYGFVNQKGPYLQISATAEVMTDPKTKKKMWTPMYTQFWKSDEDPDYCILKFVPNYVEVWGYGGQMMDFLKYTP